MKVCRLLLPLIAFVLAGCGTPQGPPPKTDRYIVTAASTPFYKYGPAQGGADFMLVKDQRVTMLNRSFGFCRVMTEKGQTGYVPTEDIAPAPPLPPPPKPPKQNRANRRSLEMFPPEPPQGLPDPGVPIPSFRY